VYLIAVGSAQCQAQSNYSKTSIISALKIKSIEKQEKGVHSRPFTKEEVHVAHKA